MDFLAQARAEVEVEAGVVANADQLLLSIIS
jgi:hypothetical protein